MATTGTGLSRGAIGLREVLFHVVLAYLYARHPGRLPEMKRVLADDVLPAPPKP